MSFDFLAENKTLVSDHLVYFLQGEFGKDVVIPCRPTSPKYKVKLSIYNSVSQELLLFLFYHFILLLLLFLSPPMKLAFVYSCLSIFICAPLTWM